MCDDKKTVMYGAHLINRRKPGQQQAAIAPELLERMDSQAPQQQADAPPKQRQMR